MRYLVAIHRPAGFDYDRQLGVEARQAISALNDEMAAAGVRVFVGGLRLPEEAHVLHPEADGGASHAPGPYLATDAYVDGFWVLDVPDLDAALEWGRKAALACRGDVEVRPFH